MCKFALYCTVNIQTRSHSPVYINYTADSDQVPLPVSITPQIQTRSHSPKSITLRIQTRSHSPLSPVSIIQQIWTRPHSPISITLQFRTGPNPHVSITTQIQTRSHSSQIWTRPHSPISITLQFRIGPALQYHLYHTFRPGPVHSVSITQQIYTLQVPLPSVDYTADALVSKENGL